MKILQISPNANPLVGGQERHLLMLSKILASFGHDVTILTCQTNPYIIPQNVTVFKINSVNFLGLRLLHIGELVKFLCEHRFDICHLHYQTLFGDMILLINKKYGLPTVTTLHSLMVRRTPARFIYDKFSLRLISNLSRKVICLSPKIMQNLVKRGLIYSKCEIIPNAVDIKSLKENFQKIRKELSEPEFDMLFVGRLEQRKGVLWLLETLYHLRKIRKKFTINIVGEGPLKRRMREIILANGLTEHVKLMGYVPENELLKLFLLAKCVVIPSLYEGVPGVALEAMVAEKPLIVSNIPGLSELVLNEGNGLIVNPMDVKGFVSAIDKVLSSQNCFQKSLNNINQNILANFDWEFVATNIAKIYYDIVC
jgi:glycosyltransferase involved in cell wall biosynthesis